MDNIRDSNFELLRLLCIFGIILMHSFGAINSVLTGFNAGISLFVNSLFNTGVTCFILISGYFGITFNLRKMLKLDMMVMFYSLLELGGSYILTRGITFKTVLIGVFPIITGKYWFITCYFCLTTLTPFLNLIPEKMEKKQFQSLLALLLILFSIIPTIFYFDIMRDSGKGLVNMIMVYLIGRYIRMYLNKNVSQKKVLLIFLLSLFLTYGLNIVATLTMGTNILSFARDCSFFIIVSAIAIFIMFKNIKFKSKFINILASNVLAMYVLEGGVRAILKRYIVISNFTNEWYLFIVTIIYVMLTMIICIIINIFRSYTIARIEPFVLELEFKCINYLKNKIKVVRTLNN